VHIICNDGTTIQCQDFEAIDSGVLFFQEMRGRRTTDEEDDEEDEEESASGFVPITELRFVLPDEMVQGQAAQPAGTPQAAPGGTPTGARQAQMSQHQAQGLQGPPAGRPPETGNR